jgi:hypothetical protein
MKNTHFRAHWFWVKKKKAYDDDDSTESQGGTIFIDKNVTVVMQCKQERTETMIGATSKRESTHSCDLIHPHHQWLPLQFTIFFQSHIRLLK